MIRRALSLLAITAAMCAGDDAPEWLRQDAALPRAEYPAKTAAVALRDEGRVVVDEDGRATTTTKQSVRILNNEGRSYAVARVVYLTGTGKVRELRAWLIRPSGEVREYGKGETVDASLVDNDVYNEVRVRAISAKADAEPGSVFGFEAVTEDRSVFSQSEWTFGGAIPSTVSRYSLTLPEGWRWEARTFNREEISPVSSAQTTTWELRSLPALEDEPAMPRASALLPRLGVSYYPPAGAAGDLRSFRSWSDVGSWLSELNASQMGATAELTEKAQSLTRAAASEAEKIAAIGRFAQGSIRYVAIQTGVGRGGGYRPHAAADVLAKGYGDCKDKANLMRAMLRVVGVESFPVAIYSGDRSRVQESWPSPQQFNHAIIAVRVPAEFQSPSVRDVPSLGRLLFFDPTDEHTPFGSLPEHEEGSLALVSAPGLGQLVRVPSASAEANRLERTVTAVLDGSAKLQLSVVESGHGHAATALRALRRSAGDDDYRGWVERLVSNGIPGGVVAGIATEDKGHVFTTTYNVAADRFGQMMQNRLLVFRPSLLGRWEDYRFGKGARRYPAVFEAQTFEETARFRLPGGFETDEVPDALELRESFATYRAGCTSEAGAMICKRRLTTERVDVPAADYARVRAFFERVLAWEQSPAVLARTTRTDSR